MPDEAAEVKSLLEQLRGAHVDLRVPQRGNVVPVEITVYEDRSFDFKLKTPPAALSSSFAAGGVGDEVGAALDDVASFSASYIDRRRVAAADMALD